ncbi:tRNA lysidine(34) synthetase TilS [Gemmobacter denitrificans]|uniref:tRNA(Ile)-lysidine synthase n=1 Tax=Gemmobacter denitrificans TaxID=3123040 RepID=A0ABU8BUH1_9RHOB
MESAEVALLQTVAQALVPARPCGAAPLSLAVAVSGGGDSVALLHLLHRTAPAAGLTLHAVTVDHGLRPDSAAEAAQVAELCAGLGIPHRVLRWSGPAAQGNLMDQARRARIALIADWARGQGIPHVMLGHTADDNAESFLMNLGRAAGLDGLSGMRGQWQEQGIAWHRPLLRHTRETLRAYLRRNGLGWIDDPSNDNDRFTRVKARRALKALKPLGITVDRLSDVISNLSAARDTVQNSVAHAARDRVTVTGGALQVQRSALIDSDPEIRRRLLIAMIQWYSGAPYPPRESKLSQLFTALAEGRDATLGGVRFRCKGDICMVSRELRAVMGPVQPGLIWDHRWHLSGPVQEGQAIAALGPDGLRQCPGWRDHGSRDALLASPGIWLGDRLISAPLAGKTAGWTATLSPDFSLFVISH